MMHDDMHTSQTLPGLIDQLAIQPIVVYTYSVRQRSCSLAKLHSSTLQSLILTTRTAALEYQSFNSLPTFTSLPISGLHLIFQQAKYSLSHRKQSIGSQLPQEKNKIHTHVSRQHTSRNPSGRPQSHLRTQALIFSRKAPIHRLEN